MERRGRSGVDDRTDAAAPYEEILRENPEAALLRALREYRQAEERLLARTQSALGIGENDLTALRYLLWERQRGNDIGPKALGRYMGISSASVTTMVDRLSRRGFVERRQVPEDRRAILLDLTLDDEVTHHLLHLNDELLSVAGELDPDSSARFTELLRRLRAAADGIDL